MYWKCKSTSFLWKLLIFLLNFMTGYAQDFGYDGSIGPSYWGETYQQCVGKHQSPIDIEEQQVETVSLEPLMFENFNVSANYFELKNNGHTLQISLNTSGVPAISGGPLVGRYVLSSFHFHWGANDQEGSETKINNNSFPMELHMVFYRYNYGTIEDAMDHPDGLTVLSFLYTLSEGNAINPNYVRLLEELPKVQNQKTSAILPYPPTMEELLTTDLLRYFTYSGSLTTPPCSEIVTWIEFKTPIPLASSQVDVFRHLNSSHGLISRNFRPTQPLHGRIIRMNEPREKSRDRAWNLKDLWEGKGSAPSKFSSASCSLFLISLIVILLRN